MEKEDQKLMNLWFILTQREYFLCVCCACTDWDLSGIPYVGTQEWISSLNLNISDNWKPGLWMVKLQGLVSKLQFSFFF